MSIISECDDPMNCPTCYEHLMDQVYGYNHPTDYQFGEELWLCCALTAQDERIRTLRALHTGYRESSRAARRSERAAMETDINHLHARLALSSATGLERLAEIERLHALVASLHEHEWKPVAKEEWTTVQMGPWCGQRIRHCVVHATCSKFCGTNTKWEYHEDR